jgi:hypothetical protein
VIRKQPNVENPNENKAITIWILTLLWFISIAHFAEAICVVVLNTRARQRTDKN